MVEQTIQVGMSLNDFIERYNQTPFELVNGEIIPLSPTVAGHNWVARALFRPLDQHIRANELGELIWEMPFVMEDTPDWVKGSRTPDLLFYNAERWAAYVANTPNWQRKPCVLIPDLIIEIISPTDRLSDVQDKIKAYLADGVQIGWAIDWQHKTVSVHSAGELSPTLISADGVLIGGDVLPGFSLTLSAIFDQGG